MTTTATLRAMLTRRAHLYPGAPPVVHLDCRELAHLPRWRVRAAAVAMEIAGEAALTRHHGAVVVTRPIQRTP